MQISAPLGRRRGSDLLQPFGQVSSGATGTYAINFSAVVRM